MFFATGHKNIVVNHVRALFLACLTFIPTKKQNNRLKSIKKRIRIPTQPNAKQTQFKAF